MTSKNELNIFIAATIVSLSVHLRVTRVSFHNFAEVNFRDFLLTGIEVHWLTDRNETTDLLCSRHGPPRVRGPQFGNLCSMACVHTHI